MTRGNAALRRDIESVLRGKLSDLLKESLKSPELWDVRNLAQDWPSGVGFAELKGSSIQLWSVGQSPSDAPEVTLEFGSGRAAYRFKQAAEELASTQERSSVFGDAGEARSA